jgi:short-subunit dehydrogenase
VETGFAAAAGISDTEAAESLPKIMWLPAADVARAAVKGMDANKAVVIPGAANRVGAAAAWLSPRSVLVPMLAARHPALRT